MTPHLSVTPPKSTVRVVPRCRSPLTFTTFLEIDFRRLLLDITR